MFNEHPFSTASMPPPGPASPPSIPVSLRVSGGSHRRAIERNGLTQALFNLPPGDWQAGEKGFAARPEKFAELQQSLRTALPYALATASSACI